jgi:hypothetical protein
MKALVLALLAVTTAHASDGPRMAILVEEGGQGRMIAVQGTTTAAPGTEITEESFLDHFRITSGALITAPLPILGAGGRVGVSAFRDMIEIGAEGLIVSVPPDQGASGALGLQAGLYLQLAPVPGNWGRRFYIRGSVYRVLAIGTPAIDGWGAGFALGYRQPLDGLIGGARYLFVELGLDRQVLFTYQNDVLITPRMLTIGLAW